MDGVVVVIMVVVRTGRALGTAEETHGFVVEGLERMLTGFLEGRDWCRRRSSALVLD